MKQILFVDDDAVIADIYRRKLVQAGFNVEVARDGLAAMKVLSGGAKPDLVVLDLMIPKFSGVDVLKFIRSNEQLKTTPVIIFSNSYMSDMAQAAAVAGADKALLKSRCPPALLVEITNHLLTGEQEAEDASVLIAAADYAPTMAAATSAPTPAPKTALDLDAAVREDERARAKAEPISPTKVRDDFLEQTPATLQSIRERFEGFADSSDPKTRQFRLLEFYRKIHFLASMAGMAGCRQLAQFASVFEALLFELQEKPQHITPSAMQTIVQSVDFVERLFEQEILASLPPLSPVNVLVVDDDVISNRLVVAALHRANLKPKSESNPVVALKKLREKKYDLVLLDISMPDLDGFEVCAQLRQLPGYERTPVIFVTAHSDFENRARSVVIGGDDIIAKPILPIELAVKAVMHLLRMQLPEPQPDSPASQPA